jgi:hypothetical protein
LTVAGWVDERARTPVPIHNPAKQQSVLVAFKRLFPQPPASFAWARGELAVHPRARRRAYLLAFCAFAASDKASIRMDYLPPSRPSGREPAELEVSRSTITKSRMTG